jgi:hypothetical protein
MSNKQKISLLISVSVCLFIGCFNMPLGYYTFLRGLVFASCLFVVHWQEEESILFNSIFILIAVLYNPITPVYLIDKEYWVYSDAILIGVLLQRSWSFWKA